MTTKHTVLLLTTFCIFICALDAMEKNSNATLVQDKARFSWGNPQAQHRSRIYDFKKNPALTLYPELAGLNNKSLRRRTNAYLKQTYRLPHSFDNQTNTLPTQNHRNHLLESFHHSIACAEFVGTEITNPSQAANIKFILSLLDDDK
jgi:hypothetical protein